MKLYLKKHVIDLSIKRFGSLEEMEKVKKEREAQRFERSLANTHEVLGSSAKEMWSALNEDGADVSGKNEKSAQGEQQGRKRGSAAKEGAGQKKKKSALSGLVGIIRGASDGPA